MEITFSGSVDEYFAVFGMPGERPTEISQSLARIEAQGVALMADSTQVNIQLDRLNTVTNTIASTIDAVVVADQQEDDAFRAEIQRLKDLVAGGEAVSQAQLDALAASISARNTTLEQVSETLKAIGTNPADPIPT